MNALIKKILAKVGHSAGPMPSRDWLLLGIAACVLVAVSIMWNVWFFAHIEDAEPVPSAEGGALEAYPAELVREVFEMRASTSIRYREAYPFVDPSR